MIAKDIFSYSTYSEKTSVEGSTAIYRARVYIRRKNDHDSITDAVILIADTPLLVLRNGLMITDFFDSEQDNQIQLKYPYPLLNRGIIKWAAASPLFFYKYPRRSMIFRDVKPLMISSDRQDTIASVQFFRLYSTMYAMPGDPDSVNVMRYYKITSKDSAFISFYKTIEYPRTPQVIKIEIFDYDWDIQEAYFESLSNYAMEFLSSKLEDRKVRK